jgi:hypothetical protein
VAHAVAERMVDIGVNQQKEKELGVLEVRTFKVSSIIHVILLHHSKSSTNLIIHRLRRFLLCVYYIISIYHFIIYIPKNSLLALMFLRLCALCTFSLKQDYLPKKVIFLLRFY